MSKIDKKKAKLKERIYLLENELRTSLGKKSSDVEIDVSTQIRRINELKQQLLAL